MFIRSGHLDDPNSRVWGTTCYQSYAPFETCMSMGQAQIAAVSLASWALLVFGFFPWALAILRDKRSFTQVLWRCGGNLGKVWGMRQCGVRKAQRSAGSGCKARTADV